jgi:S-DNA-T family DNA segregation ATPase FtsK/SpoIIIE
MLPDGGTQQHDARWLRPAQVAAMYDISENTLAQLRYQGTGPMFSKRGRLVLYRISDLENWLEEGLTHGGGEPPSTMEALGIEDLGTYDPRRRWADNAASGNLAITLGFPSERAAPPVVLDLSEMSAGGTGPHGIIQGVTGSGKSYLIQNILTSLCLECGPEKLNLALLDFRGNRTFLPFAQLPHTALLASDIDDDSDLGAAVNAALDAEIQRRRMVLRAARCKDIRGYREKCAENPEEFLPFPHLLVVADEFHDYMKKRPGDLKEFRTVTSVGWSLGIHLLLSSQIIDVGVFGEMIGNMTYGISLRAASEEYSLAVLGVTGAEKLTRGTGVAMIRRVKPNTVEPEVVTVTTVDTHQPYADASNGNTTVMDTLLARIAQYRDYTALPLLG